MFYYTIYPSPLGELTLACTENGQALVGLWIAGQKYFLAPLPEPPERGDHLPVFTQARAWLGQYFAGERPSLSKLSLAPAGGAFRQRVWQLLRHIPYGQVTTYGTIARQLAAKQGLASMSSQAVGGAVGHNPLSIIIPCHRVVGTGGSLTGYAGGIDKKIWLLEHEGVDTKGLTIPKKGAAL